MATMPGRNVLNDPFLAGRNAVPRFLFLLQPEFPMNAFILATEPLRIANQNSGRQLFDWSFASETGQPVRASNGMWVAVEHEVASLPRADFLLLFERNANRAGPGRDVEEDHHDGDPREDVLLPLGQTAEDPMTPACSRKESGTFHASWPVHDTCRVAAPYGK